MSESKNNARSASEKRPKALRAALAGDRRDRDVASVPPDRANCTSLTRLRDLGARTVSATSRDITHITNCRRCTVSLHAMQAVLLTSPENVFEKNLTAIKDNSQCRQQVLGVAQHHAEELFCKMDRRGAELERDPEVWLGSHELAQALRHCHCARHELRLLIDASSVAMRAAVGDPLTAWATSFDAAWYVLAALAETVSQADGMDDDVALAVGEAYAAIVHDSPEPLKVVLAYGISGLIEPQPHRSRTALHIATRINDGHDTVAQRVMTMLAYSESPEIREHFRYNHGLPLGTALMPTIQPYLLAADGEFEKVEAIDPITPRIAATVRRSVSDAVERMLASTDAAETILQLIATRRYLRRTAAQLEHISAGLADFVLGDVMRVIVRQVQRDAGKLFLAVQLALATPTTTSIATAFAELLTNGDPGLRQALFNWFVESLVRVSSAPATKPRFVGDGTDWTFRGGAGHPLNLFGQRAARLARHDDALARLLEWTNARLERLHPMTLEEPAGV